MVVINAYQDDVTGDYIIQSAGHANSDVKGKDLVCACVSILVTTLGQMVKDHEDWFVDHQVLLNDGTAYVRLFPNTKVTDDQLLTLLETVFKGFEILQFYYPDNVKFTNKLLERQLPL